MTTTAPHFLPAGRELTRADLDALPDDGHRYELIDGILIVSPAPRPAHQRAVAGLYRLLYTAAPADVEVLFAPLDVTLSDDTVIQPDLLVAAGDAFTETGLPTTPLLAVEVLSPASRGMDLLLKKDRLERAGCAHYWVADPDEPSLIAWTLTDGAYRQTTHARGEEIFEVVAPFRVRFAPTDLSG